MILISKDRLIVSIAKQNFYMILSGPEYILLSTLSVVEAVALLELCPEFSRTAPQPFPMGSPTALVSVPWGVPCGQGLALISWFLKRRVGWGGGAIFKFEQRTDLVLPSCNWTMWWKLQLWWFCELWWEFWELWPPGLSYKSVLSSCSIWESVLQ